MHYRNIVTQNRLQVGDRLVVHKGIYSKHHGIFAGYSMNGVPLVAENQNGYGVRYTTLGEFLSYNPSNLVRIERFPRSENHRLQVVNRINALIGTPYNLVNFNCEHFAELIQKGTPKSRQIENVVKVGFAGLLIFAGMAIVNSNSRKE